MSKKIKKILSLLLVILITFSATPMASAAISFNEVVGDDKAIKLEITTDKGKYSWGDTIVFKVVATNVSDVVQENVIVTGQPRQTTLFWQDENVNKIAISRLNPGESRTVEIGFHAEQMPFLLSMFVLPWIMLFKSFGKLDYKYAKFNNELKVNVGVFKYRFGFFVNYGGEVPANAEFEIKFSRPKQENIVAEESTGIKYVNNEILLSSKENISFEKISDYVTQLGGSIVGFIKDFGEYQVRLNSEMTKSELEDMLNRVRADSKILYASLNYGMDISSEGYFVPSDPWGGNQNWSSTLPEGNNWGVEAINAPQAWDHRDEMNPITIGLIDENIDRNHSDLTVNWVRDYDVLSDDHGTHVAGTMAADMDSDGITGVMPTAKSDGSRLVTLNAIHENGRGFSEMFTFELKSCFAELVLRGTKVINISQGFNWYKPTNWDSSYYDNGDITSKARVTAISYSKPSEVFLKKLLNMGYEFVIVGAAGNDRGIDAKYASPWNCISDTTVKNRIIVVGAIGTSGIENASGSERTHRGYYVADFSNIGERVDVVAPGVKIYSTVPTGLDTDGNVDGFANTYMKNGRMCEWSGTSMAAPHVSGVAAMVWSMNPLLTGAQVKEIVKSTADRPISYEGRSYNILNAENAVNEAINSISDIDPWTPDQGDNGAVISRVTRAADSSQFISGASVSAYSEEGVCAQTVQTDSNGQFELIIPAGVYTITVSKDGYIPNTMSNVNVDASGVHYISWFSMTEITTQTNATAKGKITDATTNNPVSDVSLVFTSNDGDTEVTTVNTDSNGNYSVELPVGYYRVVTQKSGYISTAFFVTVSPSTASLNQNATISKVIGGDAYRIVLTWGENPPDLDTHIIGNRTDGTDFHVYYSDKDAYDGDVHVANLDIDDISSYGPETLTLIPTTTDTYTYFIHNYSGNSWGTIADSGAQIKLYKGDTLLATYNAPTNQGDGLYWTVFKLTNGVVERVDRIGDDVY